MKRVIICILLIAFTGSIAYSGDAPTIVALKSRSLTSHNAALEGFKDYIDIQGTGARIIEYDLKAEERKGLSKFSEEIKSKKPNLVLALGTPAAKVAQEEFANVPVLFTMVLNPERNNISPPGISMNIPYEQGLKYLRKILPGKVRIGLIYSSRSASLYKEVSHAGRNLGFKLVAKKVDSEKQFPEAIKALSGQIDLFLMLPDSSVYFPKSVEYLLRESLKNKFAVVGLSSNYVRAGALISFDCDYRDLGVQSAGLALKMLSEKAVLKRIVEPREVKFSLNLIVAKRLGLEIAPEVIEQASEVFGR